MEALETQALSMVQSSPPAQVSTGMEPLTPSPITTDGIDETESVQSRILRQNPSWVGSYEAPHSPLTYAEFYNQISFESSCEE